MLFVVIIGCKEIRIYLELFDSKYNFKYFFFKKNYHPFSIIKKQPKHMALLVIILVKITLFQWLHQERYFVIKIDAHVIIFFPSRFISLVDSTSYRNLIIPPLLHMIIRDQNKWLSTSCDMDINIVFSSRFHQIYTEPLSALILKYFSKISLSFSFFHWYNYYLRYVFYQ